MQPGDVDGRIGELAAWIARAGVAAGLTNYGTAAAVRANAIAPADVIAEVIGNAGVRIAEIGPGSGALGLAIAMLLPGSTVTLLDSSGKSVAFIEMTALRFGIRNAVPKRVRLPVHDVAALGGPFDYVVVRAFASGPQAISTAASLCSPCGRVFWLHSEDDAAALRAHGSAAPVLTLESGVERMAITAFVVGCKQE